MSEANAREDRIADLFNLVRKRYGHYLSSEQLEEVRKGVERIVQESEALRSVKLDNGDEPLSLFRPYRAEEK